MKAVLLPVHAVDAPRELVLALALVLLGHRVLHLLLEVLDGRLDEVPARGGRLPFRRRRNDIVAETRETHLRAWPRARASTRLGATRRDRARSAGRRRRGRLRSASGRVARLESTLGAERGGAVGMPSLSGARRLRAESPREMLAKSSIPNSKFKNRSGDLEIPPSRERGARARAHRATPRKRLASGVTRASPLGRASAHVAGARVPHRDRHAVGGSERSRPSLHDPGCRRRERASRARRRSPA